jgi:hypothetical protein
MVGKMEGVLAVLITDLRFRGSTFGNVLDAIPLLFLGSQNFTIQKVSPKLTSRSDTPCGVLDPESVKGAFIKYTPDCHQSNIRGSRIARFLSYFFIRGEGHDLSEERLDIKKCGLVHTAKQDTKVVTATRPS